MYTNEEVNLIVISSFSLSYNVRRALFSDYASATPNFKGNENYLIKTLTAGVYNKVKADFESPAYREKVLSGLEKKGIKCVTYFSEAYPETLKNTPAPPDVLYCKGDISLLKSKCLSIVGSRKTTPKALSLCGKIAGELTEYFTVVSGIAEGADKAALEGALDAGGKVISVLANGLDHAYPACNANLLKKIAKEGLVISEHLPEEKPKPYYFPIRNRIIAGISMGTLVVSAGEKSGALITAAYATDYNRDVFAFPYSVGIASGAGCNELIKNGASLTRNVLDIFAEYGLDFKRRENIQLSKDEEAVYEIIKNSDGVLLSVIADRLNKPVFQINAIITMLTMKGMVVGLGGNRYSAQQ